MDSLQGSDRTWEGASTCSHDLLPSPALAVPRVPGETRTGLLAFGLFRGGTPAGRGGAGEDAWAGGANTSERVFGTKGGRDMEICHGGPGLPEPTGTSSGEPAAAFQKSLKLFVKQPFLEITFYRLKMQ